LGFFPTGGRWKSKIRHSPFPIHFKMETDYGVAPLDLDSYYVGLGKFNHGWLIHDWSTIQRGCTLLQKHYSFPFGVSTKVEAIEYLDLHKSAGAPWDQWFSAQDKLDAIAGAMKMSREECRVRLMPYHPEHVFFCTSVFDYFYDYWRNHVPIFSSTLKDEFRLHQKNARFFIPAPIEMCIVGNFLFGRQNDHMIELGSNLADNVTIGLTIPGVHANQMWRNILIRGEVAAHDYDGAAWDANCSMSLLLSVREFRKSYLQGFEDDVDRYYDYAYNRTTRLIDGNLVLLCGMPSGHNLTSTDNSLVQVCCIELLADSIGVPPPVYYVNGDDLIVSDTSGKFGPEQLVEHYYSFGMCLETDSFDAKKYTDLMYLGMVPVHFDTEVCQYRFRTNRLLASISCQKCGTRPIDYFAKLVSIAALFYYEPFYNQFRQELLKWANNMLRGGHLQRTPAFESLYEQVATSHFHEFLYRGTSSSVPLKSHGLDDSH
jgi:hypothetical protein